MTETTSTSVASKGQGSKQKKRNARRNRKLQQPQVQRQGQGSAVGRPQGISVGKSTKSSRNKKGASSLIQAQTVKVTFRNIGDPQRHGTVKDVLNMIASLLEDVESEPRIELDSDHAGRLILNEDLTVNKEKAELEEQDNEKRHLRVDLPSSTAASERDTTNEAMNSTPISARPLYVVPPKISKRRGEKSGCAYVILVAPLPNLLNGQEGEIPKEKLSLSANDRARFAAVSRLQLRNALNAISQRLKQDGKLEMKFAGTQVQTSVNAKVWKPKVGHDRRAGTIENSSDFQEFMNAQVLTQENLEARPKPAPGGGVINSSISSDTKDGDQELISPLVLHIRAKRAEQHAKKKNKKKQQGATSGKNPSGDNGKEAQGGKKASKGSNAKEDKRKRQKARRSKTKKKHGQTPSLVLQQK